MARPHVAPIRTGLLLVVSLTACDSIFGPSVVDEAIETPVEVQPGSRFVAVGAGWLHTCATGVDGVVYCWGRNEHGELGGPRTRDRCDDGFIYDSVPCTGVPQAVVDAPSLHQLRGSTEHTCGLAADGRVWCWGFGAGGQLGDGLRASRAAAAPVAGEHVFTALDLSVGDTGSCGIAEEVLYCWGPFRENAMGASIGPTPTAVPSDLTFTDITVGQLSTCGLVGEAAWCWGSNWYGQLGAGWVGQDNEPSVVEQPVAVLGGHAFTRLAMTLSHTCGLRTDGGAWCWGVLPGMHGYDPPAYGPVPEPAGGPAFVELYAGGQHVCGLTAEGAAWCWGMNVGGALGDGTLTDRREPVRVRAPAGVRFQTLGAGGGHTCGIATDGRLFCWGHNGLGQVGRPPAWLER